MSQAALADKLGYSVSYISKLERGEMNPTLKTLFDIADSFGIEADALIRRMKRTFDKGQCP
jgi:transcriptional regulator with XRE-family HTH domain